MIIGIGNIVFGGTGKTQMVIAIGERMKEEFAVIHSGYKGRIKDKVRIIYDGNNLLSEPYECGDEPVMLSRRLKKAVVVVGKKREKAIELVRNEFSIRNFIVDDAFQYRRLKKDINIMMVNSDKPFLIPRDNPFYVNLADVCVVIKRERFSPLLKNIKIPIFMGSIEPLYLPKIKRIIAFCGIGNPEGFKNLLIKYGYHILTFYKFSDHHFYNEKEINFLKRKSEELGAEGIITTEKDIVKIKDKDIFFIPTKLNIEEGFFDYLSFLHPEIPIN